MDVSNDEAYVVLRNAALALINTLEQQLKSYTSLDTDNLLSELSRIKNSVEPVFKEQNLEEILMLSDELTVLFEQFKSLKQFFDDKENLNPPLDA